MITRAMWYDSRTLTVAVTVSTILVTLGWSLPPLFNVKIYVIRVYPGQGQYKMACLIAQTSKHNVKHPLA